MSTSHVSAASAVSFASEGAVTYERIAASVAAITVHGTEVHVHWKDPLTGALMGESSATMATDTSLGGRMLAQGRRSLVHEIASAIMRVISAAVSSALGGGAGRIVRDLAYTASHDLQVRALAGTTFAESARRDAVVRAFAAVRECFAWDAPGHRFVAR